MNGHQGRNGGHGHDGGHAGLWLAAVSNRPQPVHRVGRRQFLTQLGRNTFAVAVLGGFVAACTGDDEPATSQTSEPTPPAPSDAPAATDAPATSATTDGVEPTGDSSGATSEGTDAGGLRWAQASLGFVSAYVLVRGSEAAVVDTGSSGSADQIGVALGTLNAIYDDVRHVVLTHSHPDHVGSLFDVLDRSPSAMAYAGQDDLTDITAPGLAITALNDGDDVFGLQVIHTPGHTPGSISVFDPGIGLLVAGDALSGNDDGTGLAGPNEQFTPDMATAVESVTKLAGLDVDAVAMGHGQPVSGGAGALLTALAAEL